MKYLAFFLSLPAKSASERTKFWRALKAAGSVALRDGVYLLPAGKRFLQAFEALAADANAAGGTADIYKLNAIEAMQEKQLRQLFNRDADYAELDVEINELQSGLPNLDQIAANRRYHNLLRKYEQLLALDFYASVSANNTKSRLVELGETVIRYWSPDEPNPVDTAIAVCDPIQFQGRIWATRARPWVDRLASAWLIQRFIDPAAQFRWLVTPADCKPGWLGFDFDGARFTHVGDQVTFETLMASFSLTGNSSLRWLGALVHSLDVGGIEVAEAAGVEAMLAGLRASEPNDDALLVAAGRLFDWLLENQRHKISKTE